jgi:N-dimethylarginine dimethylaminohydrolase
MYHLDLAFCPLDDEHALICPTAFDPASARALLDIIPAPIVLTEEEALTFCANSIVVGRTVVMPSCPARVRSELARAGFDVVLADVSEFHKAGGSIRCLTNPLDIVVGRDLDRVVGGRLSLPALVA